MKIGRRGFLKLASGLVAATVAAPVIEQVAQAAAFIPAERLDMGVPHALKPARPPLITGQTVANWVPEVWHKQALAMREQRTVFGDLLDRQQSITTNKHKYSTIQITKADGVYHYADEGSIYLPSEDWDDANARKVLRSVTLRDEIGREYPVTVDTEDMGRMQVRLGRSLSEAIDRSFEEDIKRMGEPLPPIEYDPARRPVRFPWTRDAFSWGPIVNPRA